MNNDTRKLTAKMVTEALDMLRKKEYEHKGNVFILTETQYTALFGRLLAIDMYLSNAWVKPADRLPTEVDADFEGAVLVSQKSYDDYEDYKIATVHWETVVNFPEDFEFWSSIPPLPKNRAEE